MGIWGLVEDQNPLVQNQSNWSICRDVFFCSFSNGDPNVDLHQNGWVKTCQNQLVPYHLWFFFSHPHLSAPSAPPGLISRWTNWAPWFLWPPWGAWDSPASRPTKSRPWRRARDAVAVAVGCPRPLGECSNWWLQHVTKTLPFRSISQQSGAERWVGGIFLRGGYDVN